MSKRFPAPTAIHEIPDFDTGTCFLSLSRMTRSR